MFAFEVKCHSVLSFEKTKRITFYITMRLEEKDMQYITMTITDKNINYDKYVPGKSYRLEAHLVETPEDT
jgi:predicted DNA binding CopG/RHH family protein